MDRAVVITVAALIGCGGSGKPAPQQSTTAHVGAARTLHCDRGKAATPAPPSEGGYRRLPDEAAAKALREAMANVESLPPATDRRVTGAVSAALDDLSSELGKCLHAADAPAPDQHYAIRVYLSGNSLATVVSRVALKRVEIQRGSRVEIATKAEACFNRIFQLLELPPSGFVSQYSTTFRADFCDDVASTH